MGGMKVNNRQMKQAMKKMGITQAPIEGVTEVVIRTKGMEYVVRNADVLRIEMGGNVSYQVSGTTEERPIGEDGAPVITFPDADIELVMAQTGCDRDKAVSALEAAGGQPAEAIISIMSE